MREPKAFWDRESIKEAEQGGGAELLWGKEQKYWQLIQESRQLFTGKLFVCTTYWLWGVFTIY